MLLDLLAEVVEVAKNVRSPKGDERFTAKTMQDSWIEGLRHKIKIAKDARRWIVPSDTGMVRAFGLIGELDAGPLLKKAKIAEYWKTPFEAEAEVKIILGIALAAERHLLRA